MGILPLVLILAADFPICTADRHQEYPAAKYVNGQYYVFWKDSRYFYPYFSIFGARVTTNGTVIDPNGKLIFRDSTSSRIDFDYDGSNFLVVFRDGC